MNATSPSVNGTEKKPRILIAGAGIGGLAVALSLLKFGFDVEVYEQAPEVREIGAALWISPNGAKVLFELGLGDGMRVANLASVRREICLWNTGQAWPIYDQDSDVPWDRTLYMMLRSEPQRLLAEGVAKLKPHAIHLNKRAVGFTQTRDDVTLHFADGTSATGDALIGADGLHSKIRQAAFGPAPGNFTGVVAWRGLVPKSRLPERFKQAAFSTWVGPTAHITVYHVRKGAEEIVSFSGQADSNWQSESWSEQGSIDECLQDFSGWHADIHQLIRNADTLYKWGLFLREPLQKWTAGRVTLLGDACHPMVPYLGQGANMAIEDAYILARCFAMEAPDVNRALIRYERARVERTGRAVKGSADMQGVFHNPALESIETAHSYISDRWSPQSVSARNDWLFRYDAVNAEI